MTKLARYLKPFVFGLLLAIALLFGQALCDLNLPNYMSDIVNVGLQQSGVEHAAPEAISVDGLNLLTITMTDAQKELVTEHYRLVSTDSANAQGKTYESLYPNAVGEVYVRADVDADTLSSLDEAFGLSAATMMQVVQDAMAQSGQDMSQVTGDQGDAEKKLDLAKLYQAMPMLQMMPPEALIAARAAAASNPMMVGQSGIFFTRAFLEELGVDLGAVQSAYIWRIGLFMLGIALLGGLATVLVSLISTRIAAGVSRNLRRDVFAKVGEFSNGEFDKYSTASLITRCTNDITQIQQVLIIGIRMVCYAPIMGIGGIIMAVGKSASMSWIIAVAVAVLIGLILIIVAVAMPKFKILQKYVDKLNLVTRENLSGLMVIRAFGAQAHEKKRFDAANKDLTKTNLFINRVMVFMMPMMMLIMNGVTLLIIWVGAQQISESALQVGDMMAFMQYAMQIIMAFLMISMMFILIPRASVSAVRINEVLKTKVSIVDPKNPKPFDKSKKGLVEFRHVHFRYEGAEMDAVSDISFTAHPGQTTAIIGSTGSGKSTLLNLALRFYDVTEGAVLIDGTDVREVRQAELREKIGYVPQKGILLSGTIDSNLRYGKREATAEEIETAARVAQAADFIGEKPEGFEAPIAQGGVNVSGGQKQRLSIARALARDPEILIFDDSFSALDFRTDATLRRALKEHTADATVIVVAQRVGTIMTAEQILVLADGKIVGRGTHKELLQSCPEYLEIASSQLSKEELA